MKKIAIFFLIVIIIIGGIYYIYLNYKANYNEAQMENKEFVRYDGKQIKGSDLTSLINKAVDNNEKNEVLKDEKGKYLNNDSNSIQIDIKMIDTDETYQMETIYNGGMEKFMQFYGEIEFQCTKIEYHQATKKVKYMLFEQITQ